MNLVTWADIGFFRNHSFLLVKRCHNFQDKVVIYVQLPVLKENL